MNVKSHLPVLAVVAVFLIVIAAGPLHSYWRASLPVVSESHGMVVCRMKFCDFQFPLPPGAHIVSVGPLTVGPDTITGSIVHGSVMSAVTYETVLHQHGFDWKPGSLLATSSTQPGGWVKPLPEGRIEFSYFGDR